MTGETLVIMAKQPVAGAVKTRLAARIGAEAARALSEAFLRDLARRFGAGVPWRVVWAVDPPTADLSRYVGDGAEQIAQHGADLAARMHDCFVRLCGDGARVVMIGADVPHLPTAAIGAAFAALANSDVVLMPTRDGGYCLIGMRAPHDVFSGIVMGTATVRAETEARAATLGLSVQVRDETFDIDELDDLRDLARLIDSGAVDLPHTAAVLGSIAW